MEVTLEQINDKLGSDDWHGSSDPHKLKILANAWLAGKGVRLSGQPPQEIIMAVSIVAKAISDGEMLQGRSEGIVVSKSAKAGDVATTKTYATGVDGQPISKSEQMAEMLIAPFLSASRSFGYVAVERG